MQLSLHLILASKSPRRQYLLRELGIPFEVRTKEVDESFPADLKAENIPLYLCRKKAEAFKNGLQPGQLLITSDTIVWVNEQVLNKPENEEDAFRMLKMLSGHMHEVFTGVCLESTGKLKTFFVRSKVFFKPLSDELIRDYVRDCRPFDKAGAYGAQESLPEGSHPCSQDEVKFLDALGKAHLNTIHHGEDGKKNYVLVDRIEGSYFNVMGFPLRELYAELLAF